MDAIMTILLCVVFGFMWYHAGADDGRTQIHTEALKNGCMEYNKTNGELYWVKEK